MFNLMCIFQLVRKGLRHGGVMWLLVCCACVAQPTTQASRAFEQLRQIYLSDEYSLINRQLVFPLSTPNLAQRTDETKATQLQIQALASWQREFHVRLQRVLETQKNSPVGMSLLEPSTIAEVVVIYENLRLKKTNFGAANRALWAAQQKLLLSTQAASLASQMPASAPKPPSPKPSSQPNRASPAPSSEAAPAPFASSPPTASARKSDGAASKSVCDQKLMALNALLLEEENWAEVTSSLNLSLKKESDQHLAQQAQSAQMSQRQDKIRELSVFREQHCSAASLRQ